MMKSILSCAGSVVPYVVSCFGRIYPGQTKLLDVRKAVSALAEAPSSDLPAVGTAAAI